MKFGSYINNEKCLEWGLDLTRGALMDLLSQLSGWAEESFIDGRVYYWVSRNEVIKELPVAYSKPDTVYRHLMEFKKLGIIDYIKVGQKDMVSLTQKGKEWAFSSSDSNPTLGAESVKTRISIRNSSDSNPTYKTTTDQITKPDNKNTKKKTAKQERHDSAVQLLAGFGVSDQLAEDYLSVRADKGARTLTKTAMNTIAREAALAGLTNEQAITVSVARNWIGFESDWLKNNSGAPAAKPNNVKTVPQHTQGGVIQL